MTTVFVLFTREHRAGRTARDAVCHTRPPSGPEILCEGVSAELGAGWPPRRPSVFRGVTLPSGAARGARARGVRSRVEGPRARRGGRVTRACCCRWSRRTASMASVRGATGSPAGAEAVRAAHPSRGSPVEGVSPGKQPRGAARTWSTLSAAVGAPCCQGEPARTAHSGVQQTNDCCTPVSRRAPLSRTAHLRRSVREGFLYPPQA
jgi:hypothetical protein